MKLFEFFTSPLGCICAGVISSVIAALLIELVCALLKKVSKKIKHRRFIKRLVIAGEVYADGYATAYARVKGPFHQMLFVGNVMLRIILSLAKVFATAIIVIILLIVFQEILASRPVIVSLGCVFFTLFIKEFKRYLEMYHIMFEHTFGEEFKAHMMEGVTKYWDSITNKKIENSKEKESE